MHTTITGIPNGSGTYNASSNTYSYAYQDLQSGATRLRVVNAATGQIVTDAPFTPVTEPVAVFPLASVADPRISALETRVDDHEQRLLSLETEISRLDRRINQVGALSAAMDIQRPVSGKTFRLGADLGHFRGETAIGISASGIIGNKIDVGIGFATTRDEKMGKASIGINW